MCTEIVYYSSVNSLVMTRKDICLCFVIIMFDFLDRLQNQDFHFYFQKIHMQDVSYCALMLVCCTLHVALLLSYKYTYKFSTN